MISMVIVLLGLLMACQPTPQEDFVADKHGLEEDIKTTAVPSETRTAPLLQTSGNEERWQYTREYNSGNSVIVDAVLYNNQVTELPVISVSQDKFESGKQLEKIVNVFCPQAKSYNTGDKLTTSMLRKNIL